MFSHVKGMGEIQTEETPKINTFQTMRKEVSGMAVFRIEKTRHVKPPSAEHRPFSESEGPALPYAVAAGGLGLHHEGPCPYL